MQYLVHMDKKIISNITPKITNILNGFVEFGLIESIDKRIVNKLAFGMRYFTGNKSKAIKIICVGYLVELHKALLFDPECIDDCQENYGRLIQQLIRITDGILQGIKFEIEGKYPDEEPVIKTVFNNKKYEAKLRFYGDYADSTGLITLLNRILEDIKTQKDFMLLTLQVMETFSF